MDPIYKVTGFVALAICAFILWLSTNTNEQDSIRVLRASGYTNIKFTGYQWFACSESDWSQTGFTATGPTGIPSSGVVCCGLILKSCTVRQ